MLDAGSVVATLGGAFNPAGFAQFDAAMKRSAATMQASEKQIAASQKRTGAGYGAVAAAAKVGTLAIVAGLASSVAASAKFEKQMSAVKAATGAGAKDMATLAAAARKLGADTGVGAVQAAAALEELGKGGMSAEQSVQALSSTIAMAQAGPMQLADAAKTVVQALSTFNLKAADAQMVADGLASAAAKTTMDVADFAQALAQGGSVAASAGFSFDETMNVLGAMANRFKSGSDMGTSLKTAIQHLAAPTKKAADEMKRLNIDLFDHEGKAKSAAQIVQMLGDRFGEMTPKQRIASAALIAGSDSMRTLLNLASTPMDGGGIRDVGSAAEMASTKMDNLAGDWQKLKAQLQDLQINAGDLLGPSLRNAVDDVRRFVSVINRTIREGVIPGDTFAGVSGDLRELVLTADKVIGVFSMLARAAALSARAMANVPGVGPLFKHAANAAEDAADEIDGFREDLQKLAGVRVPDVKIDAKLQDEATPVLIKIARTKLGDKVQRILGSDDDVRGKYNRLRRLKIPPIVAAFLAQTGSVEAAIASLAGRSVTIPVNFKSKPFSATPPGRASGRSPGGHETALVGEGAGPEWVGNQQKGWRKVTGPHLAGLGPDDYVIPTERRYAGRALGLLASAFGVEGYAKGRKPSKKQRKPRPIPKKVYLGHSVEFFDGEVQHLEQVAQDRDKKNRLTARAKKARRELAAMKRVQKKAREHDARVKKHEDEANIQRDNMQAADSRDDVSGYKSAWKNRLAELKRARELLRGALKFAPPKSKYHQDIRSRIAQINALVDDMTGDKAGSPLEAKDVEPSTFTVAEQQRLDALDAQLALAELTEPTSDDQQALRDKLAFLEPILASAQADSTARGGMSAVAEIARDVKSTRDALTELQSRPAVVTQDQQAISDQAFERGRVAGLGARIDTLTQATLAGPPTLVLQSYVPPSPSEARRLADYTVGGIGYQGGRPASTERIGV